MTSATNYVNTTLYNRLNSLYI